ncbi:MAG: ABC transporter permease [Verrucomicrobia bacterium]|nr:ABC transporter permease [Verrucomicrobiota bacterium]
MLSDLRFALRLLAKSPGFTAAAVVVLALGIGANSAVFSLVNALLFAPPAYARPAEIAQIFSQDKKNPKSFRGFSYPTYRDIRAKNDVFTDTLAYNLAMVGVGEKENTRRAFAALVSSNYFSVLGVAPARGRAFLPEEETPGRNTAVALVSHTFWQRRNLDPALVGSSLLVNGHPFTIVGIMPEGFTGTMNLFGSELWLPLGVYDLVANDYEAENRSTLGHRTGTQLLVLGRLKPGLTATTAEPALKTLAAGLEQAFPVEQKDQTFLARPLARFSTSTNPSDEAEISTLGTLLLGMAAVVLVVACLNLANMLLARGTARRKEIAIRLALGGGRARIVRQLVVEGFVLSLLGGAAGLLLALWSTDLLIASLGRQMPLELVFPGGPQPLVLAATFGFCLLGTLAFALGPAIKLTRGDVLTDLKEQAGEDTAPRRWKFLPRHPLVVVQIALSLALLTAATLFIRGAGKAASVDTGLKTERNFLLEIDASLGGYDPARARALYRMLEEKLAALPGVEHASIASTVPFGLMNLNKLVQRAGLRPGPDDKPATAAEGLAFNARFNSVGADYFTTVGLPLLRGRAFTPAEATQSGGPRVAIVDEALAKKLWPDGAALGQRIQFAHANAPTAKTGGGGGVNFSEDLNEKVKPDETLEIVGIVPTTRTALFQKGPGTQLYLPFARGFQSNVFFHVRFAALTRGQEAAAAEAISRTVRSVDAALPVLSLRTFAQHLDANLSLWLVRAGAALFSVFGGLALGLAVVGVYGVKAYAVARRTREIGIRMALGAAPGTVLAMILREGTWMLASGVVLGFLLALATGKIVSGMLYQISPFDPVALTVAPVLLAAAAFVACWLPAKRATRISPITALRTE